MAKFVEITMFYVEQGLAQTVEVFDSTGALQYLALVDFGTDRVVWGDFGTMRNRPNALGHSCDQLANKVTARGRIDLLIISHTDNDHINLMVRMLEALQSTVDLVILGGTPRGRHSLDKFTNQTVSKQKGSAVLEGLGKQLKRIQPDPKKQTKFFASLNHYFTLNGTTYTPKAEKIVQWDFGHAGAKQPGASLRVLTSRHFVDDAKLSSDGGAYINTNSVVLAVEVYADKGDPAPASVVFLTGDIQWTTMKYLTDCFQGGGTACFPFLNAGVHRAMVVPHHGALKTACKTNNIQKDPDGTNPLTVQLADLTAWGAQMDCEILLVSAKATLKRQHPCQQTIAGLRTASLRTVTAHQNVELQAALRANKAVCNFTRAVTAGETKAFYTSYAGATVLPGAAAAAETARSVTISVDEAGVMTVTPAERGDA